MKKKKVVCIFLILICSVLGIIIYCHSKDKNESETEIRVISQRHGVLTGAYEYDGELYRSTSNGIYKYVENSGNVEIIKGISKTPFEKKQLCTTSAVSTSLGVRKHAFGRFPCSCHTYLFFL